MERKKLADIFRNGEDIRDLWNRTEAAKEFSPLPEGDYIAHIVNGELFVSRKGTKGYKLTFEVCEGPYAGRRFWADLWLTGPAMPHTKRDLGKLGITSIEQLDQPLPPGIRVRVDLVLRCNDNGVEYNRVRSFDVIGIDEPERDAFAPSDDQPPGEGIGDEPLSPESEIPF